MVDVIETWGTPAALGKVICPFTGKAQWQKPVLESEILPWLPPYLTDSCYYVAPSLANNNCPWGGTPCASSGFGGGLKEAVLHSHSQSPLGGGGLNTDGLLLLPIHTLTCTSHGN